MKVTDYTFPLKTTKLDGTKVEIKSVSQMPEGTDVVSGYLLPRVTFRVIKRGRPSWQGGDVEEFVWPSGLGE